jgi:thiol-disulfide isomerase/thioredoxin
MLYLGQDSELIWNRKFQVLYFYSAHIAFHQKMLIMLDKVEQKYRAHAFFAIDIDYFNGLGKRFAIESLPTVIVFKDSKEVKRLVDTSTTSHFVAVFDDICSC